MYEDPPYRTRGSALRRVPLLLQEWRYHISFQQPYDGSYVAEGTQDTHNGKYASDRSFVSMLTYHSGILFFGDDTRNLCVYVCVFLYPPPRRQRH